MAIEEMTVRVRLDTRQAKADLRGIGKEGLAASRRVGGGGREVSGGVARGFASGLGIGAGLGFAKRFLGGIIGDPIAAAKREAASGFRAKVEGALGVPEAMARKTRREILKDQFLISAGDPAGQARMVSHAEAILPQLIAKETSDNLIDQIIGGYSPEEVRSAGTRIGNTIRDGMQDLVNALFGVKSR